MPYHDRKSTRLNSSHGSISYAVFCLKKKKKDKNTHRRRAPRMCRVVNDTLCTVDGFSGPRQTTGYIVMWRRFFFRFFFFFFNDTATTEIYPLSLHDALPI